MDSEDYLKLALEISNKNNLTPYIKMLTHYWSMNSPTPGHGFLHAIQAAVEAYTYGEDNNYPNPEYLFVGGLFHDVYRPAEGKHGEEDQTLGADVVQELFISHNIEPHLTELIVKAIKSHDGWRNEDNPPLFDLYISLGDKAAHTTLLTDSYVWICNRNRILENRSLVYTNHLQTLTSFYKYQLRAWEIINKFNYVKGIERAINRYLFIVKRTIQKYEEDPKGVDFNNHVEREKNKTKELEARYLDAFNIDIKTANSILKLYNL
jgi:HD superfamily phosphodiesterase